ncbi:MAG: hypothetical protein GC159_12060 [Phycisphaera sp.]|nr:hypothetical protein [Phycisphaera sp.]
MADEAVVAVIDALEQLSVPYMLVGSLSSSYWGIERSTRDADFTIKLEDVSIERIAQQLGPSFRMDPQVHFEAIAGKTRHIALAAGTQFRIDFFELGDDPHGLSEFQRRRQMESHGRTAWVPTPEDVIIEKARWSKQGARRKDEDDIIGVIAVQGVENLDWQYIYRWADEHGTRELIERLRASVPEI